MPKPSDYDNQADFISACIPIVLKEGTAKDQKQAAAICHSMWENRAMSAIQSVVFRKNRWDAAAARRWLLGRKMQVEDMDETKDSYRFRQIDPKDCVPGSFKTITKNMPAGVAMVSCDTNRVQSTLEERSMDPNLNKDELMRVERVANVDVDNGTFGMTLATEGEASDGHILSIDGAQLPERVPMLISHWNEPTKVAGAIFRMRRHLQDSPKRLTAVGMMELDGEGEGVSVRRDLMHMISQGHVNAVSVRWDFDWKDAVPRTKLPSDHMHYIDSEKEPTYSQKRYGYLFKKWTPREGSIVALGADPKALIGRANNTDGKIHDFWTRMLEEAQASQKEEPTPERVMPDLAGLVAAFGARIKELGPEAEQLMRLGVPVDELMRVFEQNKPVAPVDETVARLMQKIETLESRLDKAEISRSTHIENGRVGGSPSDPSGLAQIVRQAITEIRSERRMMFDKFRREIRTRQGHLDDGE